MPDLPGSSPIVVSFLVDTGADMTVLHPQDSERLITTADQWQWIRGRPTLSVGGAGHGMPHYSVDASIFLMHVDKSVSYHDFKLYIAEPHAGNQINESLLGRDVLRHYVTSFDGVEGLTLTGPS
ncbi:MAG: retropepsin-like aspartic protease [Dehalococcoidia bacterium]